MKRILLFLVTNILIMATIQVVVRLLGLDRWFYAYGINYQQLALFCLVWGMGGAFISLSLSKVMAKWMMGVQVIDPSQAGPEERWLIGTVHRIAEKKGLHTMPEVGIYESPEVNAFATGPSKNSALVAVSSGILQRMDHDQLEGVLGHELSHVANGDMVTMTLLQGVVNAFVMFLARVIAFALAQGGRRDDRERGNYGMGYFMVEMALQMVFSLLGSLVIFAFSRYREYRADLGGAQTVGKYKMIGALKALKSTLEVRDPAAEKPALAAFKIANGRRASLFASHPSLDDRIARLEQSQILQ
jgi:heat shock protein HtpX